MASTYKPTDGRVASFQSVASNSTYIPTESDESHYSRYSQFSQSSQYSSNSQNSTNPRLKQLPLPQDPRPSLHNRQPSLDYLTSNYQPRSRSRDQSPSPKDPYAVVGQSASPYGVHPSRSLQDLSSVPRGRSPPKQLSLTPQNDAIFEESLPPPPRFGDIVLLDKPSTPSGIPTSRQGSPTGSYDSRPGSAGGAGSRNISPQPTVGIQQPPTPDGKLKKKGWLGGKSHNRSKNGSDDQGPQAWILTTHGKAIYDLSILINSRVPELWDDKGDTFVHLFPSSSGQGPSFRIHSSTFASSRTLTSFAYGGSAGSPRLVVQQGGYELNKHMRNVSLDSYGVQNGHSAQKHMRNLSMQVPPSPRSPPYSGTSSDGFQESRWDLPESPREYHIYLPLGISKNSTSGLSIQQTEQLVATRNLFAFITGQALVATPAQPTVFAILLNVANLLQHYDFTNFDGTTFGEVPAASISRYIEEFQLTDVRASREKTMEAIALGERLKCWELYNEGFVHAVGKWDEMTHLKSPVFQLISNLARTRMERANRDLDIRRRSVELRLQNFEIPSLWAGIADTNTEFKSIDFKAWKTSFLSMRKYILSHYQKRYGAWPPKASSKKNRFTESGLNRLLLREVYQDFSDLYDMLVDRTSMTPRTTDFLLHDGSAMLDPSMPTQHVLRQLLSEFDRSSPPIQPPVPFDTPMLPNLEHTRRELRTLPEKKQEKEKKKSLKGNEINQLLLGATNLDSIKATPFIESFIAYERQAAHSKSVIEISNIRIGQWIFLYAVLQSLPLVIVDAPGLEHTDGVEYFLCEVPKGSLPWCKDDPQGRKKAWYSVPGGQGVVSLPSDSVDHSIDGIYHRSHCWMMAEKWLANEPRSDSNLKDFSNSPPRAPHINHAATSPLPLPPPVNYPHSRSSSVGGPVSSQGSHGSNSPIMQGLEALPLPPGVAPYGVGARQSPSYDPTKSFEGIVSEERLIRGGGKKK